MGITTPTITGTGLGLRRSLMGALAEQSVPEINFLEVAPENWMGVGGALGRQFRAFTERYPMVLHGLSLSVGGPAPLDETFVHRLKSFIKEHQVPLYSEHLSYCSDDGHLYDLMPIPFTEEAVHHVATRIRRVQDILEQRIAIENISYYAAPGQQMSELEFVTAVLEEADCDLLLDVNNIYVNSINHGYEAEQFLQAMPAQRIAYIHVAGHYVEEEDFLIDTHGAEINDPVWALLESAYEQYGVIPTLLERDFNIPPLEELLPEVKQIHATQQKWSTHHETRLQHG